MFVSRKLNIADVLSRKSAFLFGPRQSGKSSLIRETLQDAQIFDLLSSETFIRLSQNPRYIEETCTPELPRLHRAPLV